MKSRFFFFSRKKQLDHKVVKTRQKIEDKRKLMRNSCFLPPGAVVLIGDFCSRLSNEVFDELERMTKALQLLYWLHVCSRCGFILASQQWETAQVYDEILDVTLGDDITFRFLSCVPHTTI